MEIIEHDWSWTGGLTARPATDAIVLHHAAATNLSAEDVDRIHKSNGWSGIGYHFYVRRNGAVHRGRPEWAIGAHVKNHNSRTLGICAEGNYETETSMPAAQEAALRQLVAMLRARYNGAAVKRHSDYMATACPGRYYPFEAITAQQSAARDSAAVCGKNDEQEGEAMERYDTVEEMPAYYRAEAQRLIDRGALRGRGEAQLDVSEDMLRTLIICQRMIDEG